MIEPDTHRFIRAPHRTIAALAVPVFFTMVAEPLTGLVDTAFVARLGVAPLAALGVAVAALSSIFWVFNFLGIGTQTEVAQALGGEKVARAAQVTTLALYLSIGFGLLLILVTPPWLEEIASLLGASGTVQEDAVAYMSVRLWGAPAILLTLTAFGALRGRQDMHTPLWIALTVNGLNILLDGPLIFGLGPFPAWGIVGAAAASIIAQWIGALLALLAVVRHFGWSRDVRLQDAIQLLKIGGDLFARTGLLTLFLLLTTRLANQISPESGAAHQAIRQVWLFTAMGLDALALTAQSLVGFFLGARQVGQARRVAWLTAGWAVGLGMVLAAGMWVGQDLAATWLVPPGATPPFYLAWLVAAAIQPLAALAFVTDGVHWGSGDFRFLRNAMLLSTGIGCAVLLLIDPTRANALAWLWGVIGLWNLLRAALGVVRIWPGIGRSPFRIVVQPSATPLS
ncbi:MAG: MATE family efflux transporter [Chloroflexota bacterium]|nr:MATE family efflux transporter [Chloroflexota bacterium]